LDIWFQNKPSGNPETELDVESLLQGLLGCSSDFMARVPVGEGAQKTG
jgi:hypothetical protein